MNKWAKLGLVLAGLYAAWLALNFWIIDAKCGFFDGCSADGVFWSAVKTSLFL